MDWKLENNYFRVPNALVDDELKNISPAACKVMLIIIRKTLGWNKIDDDISLSQIEELSGMSRPTIIISIRELVNKNIVIKRQGSAKGHICSNYSINATSKNSLPEKTVTSKEILPVRQITSKESLHTKDIILNTNTLSNDKTKNKKQFKHPKYSPEQSELIARVKKWFIAEYKNTYNSDIYFDGKEIGSIVRICAMAQWDENTLRKKLDKFSKVVKHPLEWWEKEKSILPSDLVTVWNKIK